MRLWAVIRKRFIVSSLRSRCDRNLTASNPLPNATNTHFSLFVQFMNGFCFDSIFKENYLYSNWTFGAITINMLCIYYIADVCMRRASKFSWQSFLNIFSVWTFGLKIIFKCLNIVPAIPIRPSTSGRLPCPWCREKHIFLVQEIDFHFSIQLAMSVLLIGRRTIHFDEMRRFFALLMRS